VSRPARSRDEQVRTAVVGAATKPLNIIVPVVLVVLAILIQPWLALAAIPVYAALVFTTLRDPNEVDRMLGRGSESAQLGPSGKDLRQTVDSLPSDLQRPLQSALDQQRAILELLPTMPEGMADPKLSEDLPRLLADMLKAATGARDIDSYLDSQDVRSLQAQADDAEREGRKDVAATLRENLDVITHLQKTRDALSDRLSSMASSLSIIRGRLVQAKTTAQPVDVTSDISDLRDRARTLAEGVQEAFADAGPATT
jgi:hypothetical protein